MRHVVLAGLLLRACSGQDQPVMMLAAPLDAGTQMEAGARQVAAGGSEPDGSEPDTSRDEATEPAAASLPSAPACRPFFPDADCAPSTELPSDLRCTGLYADLSTREIACGVTAYTPAFQLWSDDADKSRYVSIPAGAKIDTSDPNAFVYPLGTQFWKEFRLSTPQGPRLGETRLLRKTEHGWSSTSYVWSKDGSHAVRTDTGKSDLFGTGHDVPTREQCKQCHAGRPDFVLGWDWVMLGPGSSGPTREQLRSWFATEAKSAVVPGDDVERAALGYLHANCGVSCHNETASAEAHNIGLFMRLEVGELTSVQSTDVFRTGVNRAPNWWSTTFIWGSPVGGGLYDFRPGDGTRSYALARMKVRAEQRQMPPIGTHRVDDAGVRIVERWIEQMTSARGYPAAGP